MDGRDYTLWVRNPLDRLTWGRVESGPVATLAYKARALYVTTGYAILPPSVLPDRLAVDPPDIPPAEYRLWLVSLHGERDAVHVGGVFPSWGAALAAADKPGLYMVGAGTARPRRSDQVVHLAVV
jgi:hypothetical protein